MKSDAMQPTEYPPAAYFLHGMESGPNGSKSRALGEVLQLKAPDFQGMSIETRLETALGILQREKNPSVVLIGSSLGGLLATLLWDEMPDKIGGLLLLAPAWERADLSGIQSLHPNTQVILAENEEILSIEAQKTQCMQWGIVPTIVKDSHRLGESMDVITQAALAVCAASKA